MPMATEEWGRGRFCGKVPAGQDHSQHGGWTGEVSPALGAQRELGEGALTAGLSTTETMPPVTEKEASRERVFQGNTANLVLGLGVSRLSQAVHGGRGARAFAVDRNV